MSWRFLARWRRPLTAALVPLAALAAAPAVGDGEDLTGGRLRDAVALAAFPLQAGASRVSDGLSSLGGLLFAGGGLRRENEELRREVALLRREVREMRERAAAAERIERLLQYRERAGLPMTLARVIGHDAASLHRTLLIDRGTADGVRHNQAVLVPEGVVGRVVKVFPRSALVLLLTDPSSGIDAVVQRTRDRGVVQGRGGGCVLQYLARQAEVAPGDDVVTSGMGGRFPKGLWVGRVSEVEKGGDLFQRITVTPSAPLERLEEVWVVAGEDAGGT